MKVISIVISYSSFIVSETEVSSNVDTNQIFDNVLYYTKKYINKNKDKVRDALNINTIKTINYEDFSSFMVLQDILDFENVIFSINKSIPTNVLDKLFKSDNLKSIVCYFMPSDYVHKFASKGVSIKFQNDMGFNLSFIRNNKFKDLKSIYYKKKISFYSSGEVYDNFEEFLKVNNSLKLIDLYYYSNDLIEFIVNKLKKYNFNDVNIFIHQDESNMYGLKASMSFLRRLNKEYSGKDNKLIKIIYSDEFFKNNIFKELTYNGLKFAMVLVFYVGIVFIVSERYHEYIGILNLRLIEDTLANTITQPEVEIDEMDDQEVIEEETPAPTTPPVEVEEEDPNPYPNIPTSFDTLLSMNKDVVGWLRVNDTRINYPVLQAYDNEYYLGHDIYFRTIMTGWIFMDYRNNPTDLDRNTIIYGHNLLSGYMFGDLKKTVNYSWYTNSENQIIVFNTLNRNMKWQIFSMYKTDYTNDYLTNEFFDDNEFMNYINMVKSRSFYDFGVDVKPYDKILTISTCTGSNNRRLAIHAVLVDG